MKDQRKNYTDAFKKEAIKLVLEKGYPVSEVARNLEICDTNIRGWIQLAQTGIRKSHIKKTEQKPDEIKILEKKIHQLTMENEILKKARAFFFKG